MGTVVTVVLIVEGIEVDLDVMIINIDGPLGDHHIEVAGTILQGALPMVGVEDLGGKGLGHPLTLHTAAQIGDMLGDLGDVFVIEVFEGKQECVAIMVP